MTTTKIRVWALLALVTVTTGLSSCLKNENVTPQRPQAGVSFLNGILTTSQLDFYDQGQKINQNPLTTNMMNIHVVYGGIHTFAYRRVGQTTDLASVSARIDSMTYNTVLAFGDSTQAFMRAYKDDFTTAKDAMVNFRFFHLSPNVGPVDLYLDNQKVDSNRTYVGSSTIDVTFRQPKNQIYSNVITVKLAGTDSVIVENRNPNQTFVPNKVYTIVLSGDKSFTGVGKLTVNNMNNLY